MVPDSLALLEGNITMTTLDTWWEGLTQILKIFYSIGIFSTTILGVQTVLALFGVGDHGDMPDLDVDIDLDSDLDSDIPDLDGDHGDGGLSVLSIRTVTAFMVGFGWIGATCVSYGIGLLISLSVAIGVGLVLMVMVFGIMRFFYNMQEEGTLNYRNAIGEIATVYLPIPGNGTAPGQVEVMIQGRLQVVQAFTSRPDRIENRASVLVVELNDESSQT